MAGTQGHSHQCPVGQSPRCFNRTIVQVHAKSSEQGRMHSCQSVGLKGCVHQKRAPFTDSQAGVLNTGGGTSLECSLAKERCLGMGVSFPLMWSSCTQFSRISLQAPAGNLREKRTPPLSSICVRNLSRPSQVNPQTELGCMPGLRA